MADGRVVLVTGATRGLGEALCRRFAHAGWRVLAHGRRLAPLITLCADVGATPFVADVEEVEQIQRLAYEVRDSGATLDLLVNNAGIGYGAPGAGRRLSREGVESRLAVNAVAPILLTSALSTSISRTGIVLNVGSTNQGVRVAPDWNFDHHYSGELAYQQSKAALIILSHYQAALMREQSIRLHVVHPGTRLPTRMVFESGATSATPLAVGVKTIVDAATDPGRTEPMFITPDGEHVLSSIVDGAAAPSLLAFLRARFDELSWSGAERVHDGT